MPERADFWGIPHAWGPPELYVYGLMSLATVVLLYRLFRAVSLWWRLGQREVRWDHIPVRVGRLITYGIVQVRVLGQRYPGIMHVALAWSFFVFFMGTVLATVHSHFVWFLQGTPYLVYKLVLDLYTVLFLFGAVLAAYRRFVQRPRRLTFEPRFGLSLMLLVFIVASGLVVESLLEARPSDYVRSLSPDRFLDAAWDWAEAERLATAQP